MKGLRQFLDFDFAKFCQGKQFRVVSVGPWADYDTKQTLGSKVEVAIIEDKTQYKPGKDGALVSNRGETMAWKISKAVDFPFGTPAVPVGGVAKIYGEYQNKLSVTVTDIKVAQPAAGSTPNHATATAPGKSLG